MADKNSEHDTVLPLPSDHGGPSGPANAPQAPADIVHGVDEHGNSDTGEGENAETDAAATTD